MKKLATLAAVLLLTACRSETEFGRCVGAFQQDKMKPDLEYEVSVRNVIVGAIFFEVIAPPVVVILKETHCPIGKKAVTP